VVPYVDYIEEEFIFMQDYVRPPQESCKITLRKSVFGLGIQS